MIRYLHVTIIPLRGFMQSTPTLSNSAEIVENESRFKLTPLLLNKERFLGLSKITKE